MYTCLCMYVYTFVYSCILCLCFTNRCRQCQPWSYMCTDCLCVHNSLALHDVDIWDEFMLMYVPYTLLREKSALLAEGAANLVSLQTTHGRWTNVNVGGVHDISSLLQRGVFVSNPSRVNRCFSFGYLEVCRDLTEVAAVSQTHLQRVYAGTRTPDHDIFNEAFLFFRVIFKQIVARLFVANQHPEPPSGTSSFLRMSCVHPPSPSVRTRSVFASGCPACHGNPFKVVQVDGGFKFRKQVRMQSLHSYTCVPCVHILLGVCTI